MTIPWYEPQMTGDEVVYLKDALDRNFINDGPLTQEFEAKIANFIGVGHAVAVPSGTTALALGLMSTGIGQGDEVIVPNFTFIATANAVRLAGAEPVLVDIDTTDFNISVPSVRSAITKRTKAIIAVDVNGRGANYIELEPLCKEFGLRLFCDSAEALGSMYAGRMLGTFGDAAAFSFSANKTLTTGQGGMLVTNNEELAVRARQIKDQGRLKRGSGGDDLHPTRGFNFKFTDLQAAVGLAQFRKLPERIERARKRDALYGELLAGCPELAFPKSSGKDGAVLQWTDVLVSDRPELITRLEMNRMGTRAFWFPLNSQKPYLGQVGKFPVSEKVSARGLWLPSYFEISQQEIEAVVNVVRSYFEG